MTGVSAGIAAVAGVEPRYGADGLVPVVVQDVADGRVLMVAHADAEAIAATASTGELHFHSRSRGRLWRKGETSGNTLHVIGLELDCDGDALLATVRPHGPTCHRSTRSCFDPTAESGMADAPLPQGFAWLETLWATIDARRRERPAGSYTTTLLDGGVDATGRKVTEEATEVLMAAKDDAAAEGSGADRGATRAAVAAESADLVFHLFALLAERGVEPTDVLETLWRRHAR